MTTRHAWAGAAAGLAILLTGCTGEAAKPTATSTAAPGFPEAEGSPGPTREAPAGYCEAVPPLQDQLAKVLSSDFVPVTDLPALRERFAAVARTAPTDLRGDWTLVGKHEQWVATLHRRAGLTTDELALAERGRVQELDAAALAKLQAAYNKTFQDALENEKVKKAADHLADETVALCDINLKDGGLLPPG